MENFRMGYYYIDSNSNLWGVAKMCRDESLTKEQVEKASVLLMIMLQRISVLVSKSIELNQINVNSNLNK